MSIEQVVAQNEGAGCPIEKRFPNHQGLGNAFGLSLFGIVQADAPLRTITQQLLKTWRILRRGDDEHVPDAQPQGFCPRNRLGQDTHKRLLLYYS